MTRAVLVLGAVVAAVLVAGAALVVTSRPHAAAEGGRGYEVAAIPAAAPHVAVRREPAAAPPSWIATLSQPVQWSTAPGGPVGGSLASTNPFGGPMVLAVDGTPDGSGWLHVELPVRPNGSEGWIQASAATLGTTTYKVSVDLAARSLTVTDSGQQVLTTPVAVGSPSSPTPPDRTYLWELIRPDNPAGAYGPYIFGLAEFSDTYTDFNGGEAQIGIHGQDEPRSIGQAVSHGCVRLPNDVITRLAGMLPLGTPVTIS